MVGDWPGEATQAWPTGAAAVMRSGDVLRLTLILRADGAEWCICGGWGVDALLGAQSREHKDLDVFVARAHLPATLARLRESGYRHAYAWEENLPLDGTAQCAGHDSAFVMEDDAGHAVDIHVCALREDEVVPMWANDGHWKRSEFAGRGTIEGVAVTCLTLARQLEFHQGYEVPAAQQEDVKRLLAR